MGVGCGVEDGAGAGDGDTEVPGTTLSVDPPRQDMPAGHGTPVAFVQPTGQYLVGIHVENIKATDVGRYTGETQSHVCAGCR